MAKCPGCDQELTRMEFIEARYGTLRLDGSSGGWVRAEEEVSGEYYCHECLWQLSSKEVEELLGISLRYTRVE